MNIQEAFKVMRFVELVYCVPVGVLPIPLGSALEGVRMGSLQPALHEWASERRRPRLCPEAPEASGPQGLAPRLSA